MWFIYLTIKHVSKLFNNEINMKTKHVDYIGNAVFTFCLILLYTINNNVYIKIIQCYNHVKHFDLMTTM